MSNRKNRGDGSIRKRSDGRWEGRYTAGRNEETGKLIYKSVLARTQAECKRQLREAVWNREHKATPLTGLAQETQGTSAPQMNCQEYTVAQWLQTWYDLYAKQNIRESTQIQYSYFMNQLVIPQIGEVPLSQLTGLRLQILYQDLRINGRVHSQKRASSGLSPKTVRSVHMFLHAALEQAVRAGIIAKNPTMECKPPKLDRKEMKVIQPEQIGDYLQAAAERNVLPLFFLELTTGLRRGELLALLWSDLDPQNRSVSVTKSVSRLNGKLVVSQPKTQHSIRTLIVPQQAVDLLIQEHSLHPNNPYLFPSPTTGTMYSPETVARIHKRILRDAGLEDCRFHDLRHPYVKHTTKIFSLRLMDFQAQAYPDARRKTRGACQLHRGGQSRSPVRPLCNRKQFSCLLPQSKMSWILYAISMRLSGYTSTRSISSSASSVVSASASKIALDASLRLSCRACSSCFCFACANTAA